jgi:hypothetical protein
MSSWDWSTSADPNLEGRWGLIPHAGFASTGRGKEPDIVGAAELCLQPRYVVSMFRSPLIECYIATVHPHRVLSGTLTAADEVYSRIYTTLSELSPPCVKLLHKDGEVGCESKS